MSLYKATCLLLDGTL